MYACTLCDCALEHGHARLPRPGLAARLMPSLNRRRFVERKARSEFETHRGTTEPSERSFQLDLARTQLENVVLQAQHLSQLKAQGHLKNP